MLVLKRNRGQVLVVGDNVRITVVDCCRDWVKFGVDAPKDVVVDREEVHILRKQEQDDGR